MARLQDKVEAVLRQRPIPLRQNAHQTGFRTVREKQNNTPASASHQGPSQQASKWCKRTPGQYPAIDRVLARKQAISKLHRLRDTIIPLRPQIEEGLEANVATQTPGSTAALDLNFPQSQQLVFVHYSTCDVPSPMHSLSGTAQPAPAHLDASHSADASHFAHEQYLCFKAWRQERSNAAVIIQKHARGLLARRLCVQTRCLVSHKKLTQRRTLSSCIQWWRCFACTSSRFRKRVRERSLRYRLWQHCYLNKQFDAEAAFSCEGKTSMAMKYRQWRVKAVVLTRWQMQTVHRCVSQHVPSSPQH